VWLLFETNDQINQLFENDLGASAILYPGVSSSSLPSSDMPLDCYEVSLTKRFTASTSGARMPCYLNYGNSATLSPATLVLVPVSSVLASDQISFYVAPITMPAVGGDIVAHVTMQIMTPCRPDGLLCARFVTTTGIHLSENLTATITDSSYLTLSTPNSYVGD
jgi:hypothetical protein